MPGSAKLLALFMAMSLVAWGIIACVHIAPWLDKHSKREALLIAVMPHMFRHVGAMAMFPGLGDPPRAVAPTVFPEDFAHQRFERRVLGGATATASAPPGVIA